MRRDLPALGLIAALLIWGLWPQTPSPSLSVSASNPTYSPHPVLSLLSGARKTTHGQLGAVQENLVQAVLDPGILGDRRRENLHRIVIMGIAGAEPLLQIAQAPLPAVKGEPRPHSVQEMQIKFERGLRITALETLDRLAIYHPELATHLLQIPVRQTDSMLQFLAQVSVSGIQQGRPGKLVRMIDKIVR